MNTLRSLLSELLMKLAIWADPTGHRAETAILPGLDRRMGPRPQPVPPQAPSSDPDAFRPDVPAARRPRPGRRTES
jgi:hypothetical protein